MDFRNVTPSELLSIRNPQTKEGRVPQGPTVTIANLKDRVTAASFSQCPRCNFPSMIIFETSREALNALQIVDKHQSSQKLTIPVLSILEQHPPEMQPDEDPLWPESIRRTFSDAQRMQHQNMSPSIILTTCGTVLELALKALDQSDSQTSLFKRIEKLHGNGIITSPIKDWAHDIRLNRNDAVHDGEGDEKDAAEYIEFLKMLFNMAFSLPNRIAQKRKETI